MIALISDWFVFFPFHNTQPQTVSVGVLSATVRCASFPPLASIGALSLARRYRVAVRFACTSQGTSGSAATLYALNAQNCLLTYASSGIVAIVCFFARLPSESTALARTNI